jgi:hypothetical protein
MLAAEGPRLIDAFCLRPGDRSPGWTPDWSPPEQILGEPVSLATDVYPLGVMLSQVIGGTLVGEVRKFRSAHTAGGRKEFDVFYDPHIYVDPSNSAAHDLRPWLRFIRSSLRFSSERRTPSARLFANQLRALMNEEPLAGRLKVSLSGRMARAIMIDGTRSVVRVISDEPTLAAAPVFLSAANSQS